MKEQMPDNNGTDLDLPEEMQGSYIKVLGRAVFLVFYVNGVRKMIQTDRRGAAIYRDLLNATLANPNNNKNGITFVRDQRL